MRLIPRPPAGLDGAGRRLWRSVVRDYELRPDELIVLGAAARTADEIAEMEAMKAKMTALVPGSMGQLRANPFFAELRGHRLALGRLLAQLAINDAADAASAGRARSAAGRHLVALRYGKNRHVAQ